MTKNHESPAGQTDRGDGEAPRSLSGVAIMRIGMGIADICVGVIFAWYKIGGDSAYLVCGLLFLMGLFYIARGVRGL